MTDVPFTGKATVSGDAVTIALGFTLPKAGSDPPPPAPAKSPAGFTFESISRFEAKAAPSAYGTPRVSECYYDASESPLTAEVWTSTDDLVGRAGKAVKSGDLIVTFVESPELVTAGNEALKESLTGFWGGAPKGPHKIFWAFDLEPDAKIAQGQYSLDSYLEAWDVILGWFAGIEANEFLVPLVKLTGEAADARPNPWHAYLPSEGIGAVGWDIYPPGGAGYAAPSSFLSRLGPVLAWPGTTSYNTRGKGRLAHGIAEFGTVGQLQGDVFDISGRAAWASAVHEELSKMGYPWAFEVIYDSAFPGGLGVVDGRQGSFQIEGTDPAYPALPDTATLSAWREVIAPS